MPTILVPAPPKSAFNKNRPVSDLLQHQLKHFRHIEAKLPTDLHSNMTARDLHTEEGAARYIAHLTEALRSLGSQAKTPAAPIPIRRRRPAPPIAIAAAAAPPARNSRPKATPATAPSATPAKSPRRKPPSSSRGKKP